MEEILTWRSIGDGKYASCDSVFDLSLGSWEGTDVEYQRCALTRPWTP